MSDDPYGENSYSIKPSGSYINADNGEVVEPKCRHGHPEGVCPMCAREDFELVAKMEGSVIEPEGEKPKTKEEILRELALKLDPKHGDKLYPLEVLGVYDLVLNERHMDAVNLVGMPENYIDDTLKDWIVTIDRNRFANRLERVLEQDQIIRDTFLLRLNYAYLLEEEEETIVIHRGQQQRLLFGEVDAEGNYIGDLNSAGDLDEEDLDKRAEQFYSHQEKIFSKIIGTPIPIRAKIRECLGMMGYVMSEDVDEVYHSLNKNNKSHFESGLIARVAYLVFISEEPSSQPPLLDQQ